MSSITKSMMVSPNILHCALFSTVVQVVKVSILVRTPTNSNSEFIRCTFPIHTWVTIVIVHTFILQYSRISHLWVFVSSVVVPELMEAQWRQTSSLPGLPTQSSVRSADTGSWIVSVMGFGIPCIAILPAWMVKFQVDADLNPPSPLGLDGLLFFFYLLFYSFILESLTCYSFHSTYYSFYCTYYSNSSSN